MGILAWIVLGLIAGAIAKAIMPGNDPGGIIVTMIIGIIGAFIGGFLGNMITGAGLNGFTLWSIVLAVSERSFCCGSIGWLRAAVVPHRGFPKAPLAPSR